MFPSTSELAFQYKQSTWYQAVTKDLGAERAAGRKKYYVPTSYLLARTFSFTTRALARSSSSLHLWRRAEEGKRDQARQRWSLDHRAGVDSDFEVIAACPLSSVQRN